MNETPRVLADGQLANAKGTIYTTPTGTRAIVTFLSAFNPSGGTETVNFWVKPGSTSRQIFRSALGTLTGAHVIADGTVLQLEAGDIIEGSTTTAATVDYVITGWTSP